MSDVFNIAIEEGISTQNVHYPTRLVPVFPALEIFTRDEEPIDNGQVQTYVATAPRNAYKIEFGFAFPSGLGQLDNNGNLSSSPFGIRILVRIADARVPTNIYTVIISGTPTATEILASDFAGSTDINITQESLGFTFSGATTDPKRRSVTIEIPYTMRQSNPNGEWLIYVQNPDTHPLQPDTKKYIQKTFLEYVNYFTVTPANYVDVTIPTAQTTAITTNVKENLTVIGMSVESSDDINGNLDEMSCIAYLSGVRDYSGTGTGAGAWPVSSSVVSNPASVFLYLLTDPLVNKYATANESKIDWTSLEEWWTFCNEGGGFVPSNGEPYRITCNAVFNGDVSLEEALNLVCQTGRASWHIVDGKFTINVDKPKPYITQYFTPKNSWDFQGNKVFTDVYTAVDVTYVNQTSWEEDTVRVYRDALSPSDDNVLEMRAWGCTTYDQAVIQAKYALALQTLRPEVFQFKTDIENIVCVRGDRIQLQHDVALIGTNIAGRVLDVTTSGSDATHLILDELYTFEVGKTYGIIVRPNDTSLTDSGDENIIRASIVNPATVADVETDTLELDTPLPSSYFGYNQLVMVGEEGNETLDLIIESISYEGDLVATISAIPYSPSIFEIAPDETAIPTYDSKLTPPPANFNNVSGSNVFTLGTTITQVTDLARDSQSRVSFGSVVSGVTEDGPITNATELGTPGMAISSQGRTVAISINRPTTVVGSGLVAHLQISDDGSTWYSLNNPGLEPPTAGWENGARGTLNAWTETLNFNYIHNRVPFGGTIDIPLARTYYYRVRYTNGVVTTDWSSAVSIQVLPLAAIDIQSGVISASKINVASLFATTITINTTGSIRSENYVAGTSGFLISADGNAEFRQGIIGGFTIGATSISASNMTLANTGNLTLGTSNNVVRLSASDATYRLWVGHATAASATFSVTALGAIFASSGSVGGFTLSTTTLSGTNFSIVNTGNITLGTSNNVVRLSSSDATYRLWVGHATATSAPFRVTQAGVLTASGATISGTLTAEAGSIGGWTLASGTMRSGAVGTARIELNQSLRRVAIYDSANLTKVAMGYLDGLAKRDATGAWDAQSYGFWAKPGDKLIVDGDMDYVNGDYLISRDSSYRIETTGDGYGAVSFNGSTVLSRVSYTDSSAMTISAWVKTTENSGTSSHILYLSRSGTQASPSVKFGIAYVNGQVQIIYGNSGNTGQVISTSTAINNNQWHLVTASHSGSQILIYVDGVLVNTTNATFTSQYGGFCYIGGSGSTNRATAQIDDCRVYSRVLSADEVESLYTNPANTVIPNLTARWALDETSGTDFFDTSGNDLTMTVYAGTATRVTGSVPVTTVRLGSILGNRGLFLNEGDQTGYRAKLTANSFYVGDNTNYIDFEGGVLTIAMTSIYLSTLNTNVKGILQISQAGDVDNLTTPIQITTEATGAYGIINHPTELQLQVNSSTALQIDSSGRFVLTIPKSYIGAVQANGTIGFSGASGANDLPAISGKSNDSSGLAFYALTNDTNTTDMFWDIRENDNTAFATITGGGFAWRRFTIQIMGLDRSGRLTPNTLHTGGSGLVPTRIASLTVTPKIQDITTGNEGISATRFSTNSNAPNFFFNKSRGTQASPTIVSSGDNLGAVVFSGFDGTQYTNGAWIVTTVNGTPSANTMPSDLSFWTNDGTSMTPKVAMTISSFQNVAIGGTPSNLYKLEVSGGGIGHVDSTAFYTLGLPQNMVLTSGESFGQNIGYVIHGGGRTTVSNGSYFGAIAFVKENGTSGDSAGNLVFYTKPTASNYAEAIRINSSQNTTFGGTVTIPTTLTLGSIVLEDSSDRSGLLEINRKGSTAYTGTQARFSSTALWSVMGNETLFGAYDDANSEWVWLYRENAELELYHNGVVKAETSSDGFSITGNLTLTGYVNHATSLSLRVNAEEIAKITSRGFDIVGRLFLSKNICKLTDFSALNWSKRSTLVGASNILTVCYGGKIFKTGTNAGFIDITGNNGTSWQGSLDLTDEVWHLEYGNGVFLAFGKIGKMQRAIGTSGWSGAIASGFTAGFSLCYGNGIWLASGNTASGYRLKRSIDDGATWSAGITIPSGQYIDSMAYDPNGGLFLLSSSTFGGATYTTTDGLSVSTASVTLPQSAKVSRGENTFGAIGASSNFYYISDLSAGSMTTYSIGAYTGTCISYGNGSYLIGTSTGRIFKFTINNDTHISSGPVEVANLGIYINDLVYGNGIWVAVGNSGNLWVSEEEAWRY